jgi:hypothetical protein
VDRPSRKQHQELFGSIPGYRIDGVAACRLAWQWFSNDHTNPVIQFGGLPPKEEYIDRRVSEPLAVRLAGEYDIWDRRDERAETFQYGLRSIPLTDGIWEELLQSSKLIPNLVNQMIDYGEIAQYYAQAVDASVCQSRMDYGMGRAEIPA